MCADLGGNSCARGHHDQIVCQVLTPSDHNVFFRFRIEPTGYPLIYPLISYPFSTNLARDCDSSTLFWLHFLFKQISWTAHEDTKRIGRNDTWWPLPRCSKITCVLSSNYLFSFLDPYMKIQIHTYLNNLIIKLDVTANRQAGVKKGNGLF